MTRGQRRVWLALEEQKRRRKRAAALGQPVPAIVLTSDGHGRLTWLPNFPTDAQFNIYKSPTQQIQGGPFANPQSGDRYRDLTGTDPAWFCVVQCDDNQNDIPPYSNWVYSDGLPGPAANIVLTSDGHGHLTWTLNFTSQYDQINIYWCNDGVTWGTDAFDGWDLGSGNRDCSGTAGYFRICLCDFDGHDVLPYSNAVHSDGL